MLVILCAYSRKLYFIKRKRSSQKEVLRTFLKHHFYWKWPNVTEPPTLLHFINLSSSGNLHQFGLIKKSVLTSKIMLLSFAKCVLFFYGVYFHNEYCSCELETQSLK